MNKNVFEVPSSKEIEPMETSMVVAKVPRDMRDVVDIDAGDFENDFACAEYASEIYNYLRKREVSHCRPSLLDTTPNVAYCVSLITCFIHVHSIRTGKYWIGRTNL